MKRNRFFESERYFCVSIGVSLLTFGDRIRSVKIYVIQTMLNVYQKIFILILKFSHRTPSYLFTSRLSVLNNSLDNKLAMQDN